MLRAEFLENAAVLHICGHGPLDMDELFALLDDWNRTTLPETPEVRGLFMDLSLAELSRLTGPEMRRFIIRRLASERGTMVPTAILVSGLEGISAIRHYAVLADVSKLRDEDSLHATDSRDDAVAWLAARMGAEDEQPVVSDLADACKRCARLYG